MFISLSFMSALVSAPAAARTARLRAGPAYWPSAEFRRHASSNRRRFAARLEAGEVRAIAPRERPAQPNAGFDRRIMHDVDRALVVGRALPETREVAEIAARREIAVTPGTFAIASAFFMPSSVSIIRISTMLSLIVFR